MLKFTYIKVKTLNKIIISGRLTKDPELRKTQSNKSVANFTVAINHKYNKEVTDYFNCIAWEKTADIVEKFLGKGNRVFVSGRMESRTYDKSDGTKMQIWELIVEDIEPIDWKDKAEHTPQKQYATDYSKDVDDSFKKSLDIDDDQLPF